MWIVSLRHYLTGDGAIAPRDGTARRLAEYWAAIVADTTFDVDSKSPLGVRCRRRPARRPCGGRIASFIDTDSDVIAWHCPRCADAGCIDGWRATFWDGTVERGD